MAAGGCGYTQRVGSDRTLQLVLTEYRLIPQTVQVTAGVLTIRARNVGRLTHNLVISLNGEPTAATKPISPGQTGQLTLYLTPGTYSLASTILPDQALGDYGTLTVTS